MNSNIKTGYTIRVDSPSGAVFVHCDESLEGKLDSVMISIGKSGSEQRAWADALGRTITGMLKSQDLLDILNALSHITTDKAYRLSNGYVVQSSVDAVFYGLLLYHRTVTQNNKQGTRTYRPPRISIPKNW